MRTAASAHRSRLPARAAIALVALLSGPAALAADFALDPSRLGNSPVRYRQQAALAEFPLPVVAVRRAGLSAGPREFAEIKEKILYPLLERSRKAVAAFVLEWYPNQPDAVGVIVLWTDGDWRESQIARNPDGTYARNAHEILFAKPTP